MKARLVYMSKSYHLLLCSGAIKKLTLKDARRFIETYDSDIYYTGKRTWDYDGLTMDDFGGTTVARVLDDGTLAIESPSHFREILYFDGIEYLSPHDYAERVGRSRQLISRLCREGRIPGARKSGERWLIPEDAQYPDDNRTKQIEK